MTWTGRTGGGRTDCGGRADGRRTWGKGEADGGRMGGRADRLADGRTGGRRISEGKTPNLTCHLIWPWEIQRGRPRVTVKLPDLPPPSQ